METRTLSVPKSTPATKWLVRQASGQSIGRAEPSVAQALGTCAVVTAMIAMHVRDAPAQVARGASCTAARRRQVGRDVVLEAVFADVAQQALQVGDADYAGAAEGVERIVGEFAFADVAADLAFAVVGGEAGEAHGPGFDQAHAGAVSVFAAHGAGDDLLEIHLDGFEEMLGQIAAVEADGLIGIVAVVVVPIEQGAGSFGCELQRVHADDAGDIHFAGARHQVLAHHAHDGAGNDAEVFFERGPALDGADGAIGLRHPFIDDGAELGHLHQRFGGDGVGGDILADLRRACLARRRRHRACAAMRPRISERSMVSTEMPLASSSFSL